MIRGCMCVQVTRGWVVFERVTELVKWEGHGSNITSQAGLRRPSNGVREGYFSSFCLLTDNNRDGVRR